MKTYEIGAIYTCPLPTAANIYMVTEVKNGWVYYQQLFSISLGSGAFCIGSKMCDESKPYDYDKPVEEFVEYALMVKNVIREAGLFPQDTMMSLPQLYANFRSQVPYEKCGKKLIRSISTARKLERTRKKSRKN